ncbi:hypothetical protein VNO77_08415 [Canavalia gladiata]|uniref:Uncharacterized protein n=1 Tax=Canavalia gladiata TaxID=3824 RepID=A0AAN9MDY0_CANGL
MNSAPHLPRSSGERLDGLAGARRAGAGPRICGSRLGPNREVLTPFKSYDARPLRLPRAARRHLSPRRHLRLRPLAGVDGVKRASPKFPPCDSSSPRSPDVLHNRKVNSGTCFTSAWFPGHLLTVRSCTLREAMNVRFRIHCQAVSLNAESSPPGVVRGGSFDSFLQKRPR